MLTMPRKELEIGDITAVIDTRESLPYDFSELGLRHQLGTLRTADYSVLGLEHVIAIERKSLSDFVMCCGVERERFEFELKRLMAFEHKALVIEATYDDLMRGEWRGKMLPQQVCASHDSWVMEGVPITLAGSRASAQRIVARMLFIAARRRWREAVSLLPTLKIATSAKDVKEVAEVAG